SQSRFGEYFVQRIGYPVIRRKLLERRMQLEAVNFAGRNQPPCVSDRFWTSVRIHAGEGDRDIGVFLRKFDHLIIGDQRASGKRLFYRKYDASHVARPVIVRKS